MEQDYFVVEFAHSIHGRVKRFHITYKSVAYFCAAALVIALVACGLLSSYARMSYKASHYNQLQADLERLRTRYRELQRVSRQHNEQMASLETLANEVSVAYGINTPRPQAVSGADSTDVPGSQAKESIEEYNFLKSATYSGIYHRYAYRWLNHTEPSLWPVAGALSSSFGGRPDPFSGEGAFHTGVDLCAPTGTPVHVTADGVVESASWAGAYGKLVIVDHGNGMETYYAHLSEFMVVPGQEVQRGETIALSGGTGRATGPHIHYEVRVHGTPVNPYRFMHRPHIVASVSKSEHNDLGL